MGNRWWIDDFIISLYVIVGKFGIVCAWRVSERYLFKAYSLSEMCEWTVFEWDNQATNK